MTEFLARISARRPLVTMGVWIVLVVIALALNANLLDSATTTEMRLTSGAESRKAADLLKSRFRGPEPITEIVILQSESLTLDDPAFRTKAEAVFEGVLALGSGTVAVGQNYYQGNDESLVSADGKTTIMPLVLTGNLEEAEENVEDILHVIEAADAEAGFRVLIGRNRQHLVRV